MPKGAEARALRAAALAALFTIAFAAQAEVRTLYRWTDAQGRVQYSDKPPPASFKGEVTRIDVDTEGNTNAPPASPAAPAAPRVPPIPPDVMRDVTPDIAKERREKRAKLEQAVRAAEKKVAAAKSALEDGAEPKDDERGVVQRHYAKVPPGKSNCRTVTEGAKKTVMCPALAPNEQYYERQKSLEDALRQAQEELAQAELDYRRGVD